MSASSERDSFPVGNVDGVCLHLVCCVDNNDPRVAKEPLNSAGVDYL